MIVVGLLSGSSMDSLDVAVAEIEIAGGVVRLTPLAAHTTPWSPRLRDRLLAVLPPGRTTVDQVCALDTLVGQAAAAAADAALGDLGRPGDLVSWLGQTVYHGTKRTPNPTAPDIAATLVALTARTVADACARYAVTEVVGSGGGMHNPVLVGALRTALDPVPLRRSAELGLPVDAKEAYLTALLGALSWHGVPGVLPGATGSRTSRVLGRFSPGHRPLRLPDPAGPVHTLQIT
ncbi:anhydro-N-acetylmuramic acid kinase [Pseudonocardia sp. Cha107L01]|uniref:anhydro-N-acetylmuramic acid kinase n=1 Tax=Pseudonocardia sp. Cha107L01 TaxID=3457576 RepID=UPI00403EE248